MIKNTKYVTMDLRNGEMCYCCKSKIEIDRSLVLHNILNNVTNYRICKSCQRDEKLDEIVNLVSMAPSADNNQSFPKISIRGSKR